MDAQSRAPMALRSRFSAPRQDTRRQSDRVKVSASGPIQERFRDLFELSLARCSSTAFLIYLSNAAANAVLSVRRALLRWMNQSPRLRNTFLAPTNRSFRIDERVSRADGRVHRVEKRVHRMDEAVSFPGGGFTESFGTAF
jgi:hypothetical protein